MSNKMKIRIRTYVFGINHGQLLQAKGMLELLKRNFPDASIKFDLYHNHILKELISQIKKLSFIKSVTLLINWLYFCKFAWPFMQRDMTIFGSDTIWMHNHPVAPNDVFFFGADLNGGLLISVCPSNAGSAYPSSKMMRSLLKKFKFVGVRDNHTAKFVGDLVDQSVNIVCDPAFFIDRNIKTENTKHARLDQISVYANSCKKVNEQLNQISNSLKDDSPTFYYLGYFPTFYINLGKQFLGLYGLLNEVEKSQLLITDTFHGVIMALMTKTPFILIKSDIVLSRLNGPILECFDDFRICELYQLSDCLQDGRYYRDDDLKSQKLVNFIEFSEKHISDNLKYLVESE